MSTALAGGVLAAMLSFAPVQAADGIWTGAATNNWADDGNWTGATRPVAGQVATVNSAPANQPIITAAETVGFLTHSAGSVTINAAASLTIQNGYFLSGTGVLANAGTVTLTGGGFVNGAGPIFNFGGGVVNTNALTVGNVPFVQDIGGTLNVNANTAFGSLAGAGAINLAANLVIGSNNTSTDYFGTFTGAGSVSKVGTGTFTFSGADTSAGPMGNLTAGSTLVIGIGGSVANAVHNQAGAIFTNNGSIGSLVNGGTATNNLTVVGGVSNLAAATFTNNGTVGGGLQNAGTATNNNTINAGATNTNIFNNNGTVNGGLLNLAGTTTNAGTINGGATNNAGATLATTGIINGAVANAGTVNASGAINGAVSNFAGGVFTITGPLGGITTFTQDIGGTLNVNANTAFGSLGQAVPAMSAGTINLNNANLVIGSNNLSTTYFGAINGTGALHKVGTGTFTFSGANTSTGPMANLTAGSTLVIGIGGTVTNAVQNQAGATFINNGSIGSLMNGGTATNNLTVVGAVGNLAGATFTNNGTIGGGLQNAGTATNANIINGGVTNISTFNNNGTVNGGLLNIAGTTTNAGVINGGATNNAGATLITTGVINGVLPNGSTVSNAGIVNASGAINGAVSNFAGGVFTITGPLGGITTFTQDIGGTLNVNVNTAFGSLGQAVPAMSAGTINLNNANLVIGSNNLSTTYFGAINGTGALHKVGTGTFTFSGANTSTGPMANLTAGSTLVIGIGGTVTNAVHNHAGATFINNGSIGSLMNGGTATNNLTVVGAVGNLAGATFTNNGTIGGGLQNAGTATNANIINGGVTNISTFNNNGTVNGGLLNIAGTSTNAGTINGGATNQAGATLTTTGIINGPFANAGTVNARGAINGAVSNFGTGVFNITGQLGGIGRFTQDIGGALNLNGNNTAFGSLAGAGAIALGGGNLVVGSDNTGSTYFGTVAGAGALHKVGTGTFTFSGANTSTGSMGNLTAGSTLVIGIGGSVANGLNNHFGATLFNNGSIGSLVNAGTATNNLTVVGAVGNLLGGTFTNNGTVGGRLTNVATATNANTINGGVSNSSVFTNNGTVNAGLINFAGTATNAGTINIGATNNTGATLTTTGIINGGLNNAGTANARGLISGGVINSGAFTVTGPLNNSGGNATNSTSGTFTLGAGTSFTNVATFTNGAVGANAVTINTGATLAAITVNNLAGTFTNFGSVNATTVSNGSGATFANSGTLNTATLINGGGGTFTNGGTVNGSIAFANLAGGVVTNSGSIIAPTISNLGLMTSTGTTGAASFVNGGTFNNSGTVSGSVSFANLAGGVVTNSGSIIAPTISNLGLMTSTGTINATSASTFVNGGTFNGSGVFSAAASMNSGTFNVTGNLGNGALPVSGPFTNTGTVDLIGGNFTGLSVFNNAGTLRSSSGVNHMLGVGTFNNQAGGLVTLANGRAGDQLTIGGNYSGTAGSQIAVDVDLSRTDTSASRGDIVTVTGAATGTTNVTVNTLGATRVAQAAPIDVLRVGAGSTLTVNERVVERNGLFSYRLARNGNVYQIVSDFNSGAISGVISGIAGALTSLQAGFHQPASAIISRPDNCQPNQLVGGPFLRMNAGDTRLTNRSENSIGGVGALPSTGSSSRTKFSGIQGGLDLGLCNINGTGWNIHAGMMGGYVETQSSSRSTTPSTAVGAPPTATRTSVDVEVPFIGAYAFVTNGPFTAEFNVRRDFFNARVGSFDLVNGAQFVGPRQKLKGDGLNFNAALSYRFEFADVWYVEPAVGLSRGENSFGRLALTSGPNDFVAFRDSTSLLGRVGVNIGYGMQVTERLLAAPFVNATLWHEFGKDNRATATFASAGGQTFNVQTDRVGTFGQLGAGIQFKVVGTPLVGFVRGDMRFGGKINGQAVNAGLRLQF